MVSIIETESRQKQEIGYVGGSQDQGAKSRGLGGGNDLAPTWICLLPTF